MHSLRHPKSAGSESDSLCLKEASLDNHNRAKMTNNHNRTVTDTANTMKLASTVISVDLDYYTTLHDTMLHVATKTRPHGKSLQSSDRGSHKTCCPGSREACPREKVTWSVSSMPSHTTHESRLAIGMSRSSVPLCLKTMPGST